MEDIIIDSLKKKLAPIFRRDKRIAAAYLFGSYSQGATHQGSDIDLAILLSSPKNFSLDDALDLEVKIALSLKTEKFDLVLANNVSLILQFRVISTGKLIYVSDDNLRCDFEEMVMLEYYDFLPRLNEFNREYFAALKVRGLRND